MPQSTTTSLTAAKVMDQAASLMNDTAKTVYTYVAQLPYLRMALDELQEYMQLCNIPITNQTSVIISIPVGTTEINPSNGYPPNTAPNYPSDMVEIQAVYERLGGSSEPFILTSPKDFLSHSLDGSTTASINNWSWQDQRIKFAAANTPREIKIDYIRKIIPDELESISPIGIINAGSFLYYRTASLCSLFIGENESRANELNGFAVLAIDRLAGIAVKGKQTMTTRRRPFMSSYKSRG